jgi:hypothetical protein
VEEQTWTFTRDGRQLEIRRASAEEGMLLGIHGDGPPRTSLFADLDRLMTFQQDFEKFLLATGWTFQAYSPERRQGRERRHFSRLLADRRRWWTDGAPPISQRNHPDDRRPRRRKSLDGDRLLD